MFLKIFEISYIIKATVRREIKLFVKSTSEIDVAYIFFSLIKKILRKTRFFKFTFETQPTCVS